MVDLHNISFLPIFLYSWNPTLSSLQFSPEPPLTQRGERMRPLLLDPPYYSVSPSSSGQLTRTAGVVDKQPLGMFSQPHKFTLGGDVHLLEGLREVLASVPAPLNILSRDLQAVAG